MHNSMSGLNLLIVDDHRAYLKIVSKYLQEKLPEWQVTALDDSYQAVQLAADLKPSIAILDLNMPVSGLDIAKELRKITPQTRIIMLTLYDDDVFRRLASEAGVDEFICKFDGNEQLIPAVERLAGVVSMLDLRK